MPAARAPLASLATGRARPVAAPDMARVAGRGWSGCSSGSAAASPDGASGRGGGSTTAVARALPVDVSLKDLRSTS
ncbi:MAG: hypothetical protein ACO3DJ_01275, partial [Alphaproteobacteria bacterium]